MNKATGKAVQRMTKTEVQGHLSSFVYFKILMEKKQLRNITHILHCTTLSSLMSKRTVLLGPLKMKPLIAID